MAAETHAEMEKVVQLARKGNMTGVLTAMNAHPDLGEWGGRLLLTAAERGSVDVVRLLLEREVDLGYAKEAGWNALCSAIERGHFEIAELLVASGATTAGAGRLRGQTLLMHAAQRRDPRVTKLLLEHAGPEGMNDQDANGRTALHMACGANRYEVIKLLLLAGAGHKRRDNTGRTPLDLLNLNHVASARGETQKEECKKLLSWWEGQLQQPEVIFRARWVYENKCHALQGPQRLPPQEAALPSDWTGHHFPLPSVAMAAAREEESLNVLATKTWAKRRRQHRDGWAWRIDTERCAVAQFVVKELEPTLFKELLSGFR